MNYNHERYPLIIGAVYVFKYKSWDNLIAFYNGLEATLIEADLQKNQFKLRFLANTGVDFARCIYWESDYGLFVSCWKLKNLPQPPISQ